MTQLEILKLAECEALNRLSREQERLAELQGNKCTEARVKKWQARWEELNRLICEEEQKQ